jgi:hypothetical protein
MRIALAFAALTLAGCANVARPNASPVSPCDVSKASYECQVEQYRNVNQ